ncbi:calcium-binding protein [Antarcticirhabdus aurantiaca]|uniref:Calcium-binding protein n=1 Tax=Antarcticirhabdus aurantiaca TaxID=2606717 RepID=A0ACD4NR44_9HYPH|nr:calcium-binding protein [Antarcticirhabdus aurantiaca]WAJ29171.1 calcium-binding protein [Jeongeuplla avenae]
MKLDVQTHFSQGWNTKLIEKAKQLGVEEIRDSQPWGKVETTQGQYVFPSQLVNYMDAADKAGIASLLTFASANALYDSGLTPYTAEGRQAYANHIMAVLKKYGDQVQEIEIWNEFNTGNFKGPALSNEAFYYTELLKVVWETVKTKHPDVVILGGSVNVVGTGALEEIFAKGALDYMDAVAIHPYRPQPEHVDAEIAHLQSVMARYGEVKPIYATEFGKEFADASEAPAYMLKMATLMASAGVKESYWYALIDQDHFKNMGLLTRSGEDKPAADTFEFIKKNLLPLGDPVRIGGDDDLTLVYRFGSDTYVMWGVDRPVSFAAGGTFWNAQGQQIARPDTLSGEPIIFKGAGFQLAEGTVVADTLMQFGGKEWSYFAENPNGTLTELSLVDWDWTSYYGSKYTKPLRVNADSIAPAGDGNKPVRVVERFVSDRDQVLSIDGTWRTGQGDGVDLHLRVNGTEILSRIFVGQFNLEGFEVTLKTGDTLDFVVGPNQYVQGDSTSRQITLTRVSQEGGHQPVAAPEAGVELRAFAEGGPLVGTNFADRLFGGMGNDQISGGDGDDLLVGGIGRNLIDGGAGVDTVSYAEAEAGVDVRLSNPALQRISASIEDRLVDIEAVVGSRHDDRFSGSDNSESFFGGEGNDTFHASAGRDLIDGGAGRDTLTFQSFGGGVVVNLADASPQSFAPNGTLEIRSIEVLVGSEFDDRLQASDAGTTIVGGRGDDVILGGAGNDDLNGGAGRNTVSFEATSSGVRVSLAIETAQDTGGAGTDTIRRFQDLVGSQWDDRLTGDAGTNEIKGGAGNDEIRGGGGADILHGGSGSDVFVYDAVGDSRPKAMDTIADFSSADRDRISLAGIDANTRTAADDAFVLVEAFTRRAGQLMIEKQGDGYLVSGDVNGDGLADIAIKVVTHGPLAAGDFML